VTEVPTTSSDGPFPTKGSAVVRDWSQSRECHSLFAADSADIGHCGDQHRAGNRVAPLDRTKDDGSLRRAIITDDCLGDPVF